jgi:hypothetical protein
VMLNTATLITQLANLVLSAALVAFTVYWPGALGAV